jgi:hypothetical protein
MMLKKDSECFEDLTMNEKNINAISVRPERREGLLKGF